MKPITNGEKFKTAEERMEGFTKFCENQCFSNCFGCKLHKYNNPNKCPFAWLDLEYEEPLKPCPFCGEEARIIKVPHGHSEYYVVQCKRCLCRTIGLFSKGEAISRWNRRVK